MSSYFLDSEATSYPILTQAQFSELLFQIILKMEEEKLKVFNVTPENIKILQNDEDCFQFQIEGSFLYRNTYPNINEHVKLKPICNLIHSYYTTPIQDLSNPENFNEEAIQEFENLYKIASNPKTFYNFNFFSNTIKTIHSKFESPNVIDLRIISEDQLRFRLKKCCQCFKVNLTPMFCLSECGCYIHKNCFEKSVGDYIQVKIRNGEMNGGWTDVCSDIGLHFDYKAMKNVHDISVREFEVNSKVKSLIQYYFLFPNEKSPLCRCEGEVKCKKLVRGMKGILLPSRNCNGMCSFCGFNHKPENCEDFLKALN